MTQSVNSPEIGVSSVAKPRRGSAPILFLAALFLLATFLAWYFTWFGRELSDSDISTYLADTMNPRHVQHALLQLQQRIERGDQSARNFYPQIITLSTSAETEFRLTVAWLMGFDNQSKDFHEALLRLVQDQEPIVRRNAALALVRFNDDRGRAELLSVLQPYHVKSSVKGLVSSTLRTGSEISRGSLLARVQEATGKVVEIRSPLQGRINEILRDNGAEVNSGDELLTINSDEGSVWEALRGLSFTGRNEDTVLVETYSASRSSSDRVREQASITVNAIKSRNK